VHVQRSEGLLIARAILSVELVLHLRLALDLTKQSAAFGRCRGFLIGLRKRLTEFAVPLIK
jgi:hypothetical protein